MEKRLQVVLALIIVALLAFGCTESKTTVDDSSHGNGYNARVWGSVHGIITTQDNNTPVEGVRVQYSGEGTQGEVVSNASGFYEITGLRQGSHVLCFLSPDNRYASWQETVVVSYDSAIAHPSDEDWHIVFARNITLYRMDAFVRGIVYARANAQQTVPAPAGIEVRAVGFGGILNANFTTVTDSTGHYRFLNLPARSGVTIMAMPWRSDSIQYGVSTVGVTLVSGAEILAPDIVQAPATGSVIVLSNNFANGRFAVDGIMNLVFSQPIFDTSLVVSLVRGPFTVPFTKILDETHCVLTIDPVTTMRYNSQYWVTVTGRGYDLSPLSYNATFTTERGLEMLSTNLATEGGSARTDVGLNDTLVFTFTKPIDVEHPDNDIFLRRNDAIDVLINREFSEDHRTLYVTPIGAMRPQSTYGINLTMNSTSPEDCTAFVYHFVTVTNVMIPPQVTGFIANDSTAVDWNTTFLTLKWNAMSDVAQYQVYAYDSYRCTERMRIGNFTPTRFAGTERFTVTLPTDFDWVQADAIQTPFAHGIQVHLMVRAVNSAGEGPFSDENMLADLTAPDSLHLTQDRTANNATGPNPVNVRIRFTPSVEYCGSAEPQWGVVEAGGSPYTLPHSAGTWMWDADMRNGTLTFIVPAGSNGAADRLWMTGMQDNSGNTQPDTTRLTLN